MPPIVLPLKPQKLPVNVSFTKCHAGLIEATAPIVSDGFTIRLPHDGTAANATSTEQLAIPD